jgi:hypothetical protein
LVIDPWTREFPEEYSEGLLCCCSSIAAAGHNRRAGLEGCGCRPVWWLIHLMKSRQFSWVMKLIHDAGSNRLGRGVTETEQGGADIGLRRCRAGIVVHVKDA